MRSGRASSAGVADAGAPAQSSARDALDALALLVRGDGAGAARRLESGDLGVKGFVELCRRQGVDPLILDVFDRQVALGAAGRELERLEGRRRRQVMAQRGRLVELDRLVRSFASAGVDVVLLKGPYLAQRFHGGVHRRAWTDLDLLVRRVDLARAHELLREAGYERLSTVLLSDRLCARFTHAFDYERDDHRVDLHWSLGVSAAYSLDGDDVWRERPAFEIEGVSRPVSVLSDDYCLTALLLSFFEDLQRGAGKLKSLVDVHRVLAVARFDWRHFFELRRGDGAEGACRAVLDLYLDWLGPAENPDLAHALGPRSTAAASPEVLLGARRGSAANRRWAARHSDVSRAATFRWWLVGLPFRLAVYRRGRWRRRWRRTRTRDDRVATARR